MYEMKYADQLNEKDWENIKLCNPKIYEILQKRKNDKTFCDIAVIFDIEQKFIFFEYID